MFFLTDTLSHFHFILIIRQIKIFISPTKKLNTAKVCFCNFNPINDRHYYHNHNFQCIHHECKQNTNFSPHSRVDGHRLKRSIQLKESHRRCGQSLQAVTLTDEQMAAYVKKRRLRPPYRKISPLNISLIYNATDSLHGRRLFCFKDSTDIRI